MFDQKFCFWRKKICHSLNEHYNPDFSPHYLLHILCINMYVRQEKKHHNIKEFVGIKKIKNGSLDLTRRENSQSMVDVLTMKWMQQRELISFVKNWKSLKKILESGYQINTGK